MLSSCPRWHPHDSALPFVLPCTLSWPVVYNVDFLARRRSGVSPAAVSCISLSDWWPQMLPVGSCQRPGKWTSPLTHPGPKLIVCWTPGPTGRFGGVLRKARRGTPPDPRGAHSDRYDRKPQLIAACLLGLLVSCSCQQSKGQWGLP